MRMILSRPTYAKASERAEIGGANCAAMRRLSAAVGRRCESLFAVRRTRHDDCEAQWIGRASDAFGHRVRQDRRAVLQRRLDRTGGSRRSMILRTRTDAVFFPDVHGFALQISASLWRAGRQLDRPAQMRILCAKTSAELHDPERCFHANRSRLRTRQSKHRNSADLPHASRCAIGDSDIRSAANSR